MWGMIRRRRAAKAAPANASGPYGPASMAAAEMLEDMTPPAVIRVLQSRLVHRGFDDRDFTVDQLNELSNSIARLADCIERAKRAGQKLDSLDSIIAQVKTIHDN